MRLDEAVAITHKLAPALAQAHAAQQAARARVRIARAPWLPSLTGNLAYSRLTANFVLRPGTLPQSLAGGRALGSTNTSFNYWNSSLQLSQLLFDFGAGWFALGAGRAQSTVADAQANQALLEATLATRRAFFDAQGKQRLLEVAREAEHNQERHKKQIRGQVEVGARPRIDLARAETDVSQARVASITAANAYAVARASLLQVMGVEGLDAPYAVADDSLDAVPGELLPLGELEAEAIGARPEMLAGHAAAQAQAKRLDALIAGLGPQLSGVAQVTDAGESLSRTSWNWAVGVNVSWPLLSGGLNVGQIREAQALLRAAQASVVSTRQAIRLELATAQLGVQAACATHEATGDALANAKSQLQLAEGRYATGLGSVIELADAQLAWSTARGQAVQAAVNLATARAIFIKALGRDV